MSRAATVPAPTDILCEHCGYTLNGLPDDGRCPECGHPIADSTIGDARVPPTWERQEVPRLAAFVRTSASVTFRPTEFYRTFQTRADATTAVTFARIHWLLAAVCTTIAVYCHARWFGTYILAVSSSRLTWIGFTCLLVFPLIYLFLDGITRVAARLTGWEASYRGIRLPYAPVLRALHYHAAHYLPVAFVGMLTVLGYVTLLANHLVGYDTGLKYLYVLCGEVILGAMYLFHTYWIAMRRMMFANR